MVKFNDKRLIDSAAELLQGLYTHPNIVASLPAADVESGDILAAKGSLARELEDETFNESSARAKAILLAAVRFNALGSEDYETMRIQYIVGLV